MKFVNLTPHEINVQKEDGEIISFPASGNVARVEYGVPHAYSGFSIHGIPIYTSPKVAFLVGVPEFEKDTIFIVSGLVLEYVSAENRDFFCAPGTDPKLDPIRNEKGQISAVRCFVARAFNVIKKESD